MSRLLAIFFLLLVGCAPNTAGGVRDLGPKRQISFTTDLNYEAVYRRVLEQSRKCWSGGLITAQMVVDGDLYQDIKSGTVTVALHGGLGVDVYQVIDIAHVEDNLTKVTGHYSSGSTEKYGTILKQWVLENSKECSAIEKKA